MQDQHHVEQPIIYPATPLDRRFRWRTVIIPLVFVGFHFIFSNIVSTIYVALAAMILQLTDPLSNIMDLLTDEQAILDFIMAHYPVIACIIAAGVIPVCLVFLTQSAKRDPRIWMTNRPRTIDILTALAMMIGGLGLTNILVNIFLVLSDQVSIIETWMNDYLETAGAFTPEVGLVWLILGISVLTPIAEELLFRGVIQGELRKAMPDWAAILIQAVLFAAYHMQPIQSTYVLIPGILLGLAYYWTRSIWVPIIMHIAFNFAGSALPYMIGDSEAALTALGLVEIGFILVAIPAGIYLMLNRRRSADQLS